MAHPPLVASSLFPISKHRALPDFSACPKGRILGQPTPSRLHSDALGNGEYSLVGIEREKIGGAEMFRGGDVQHV